MLTIPPSPATVVEQTLDRLSENSLRLINTGFGGSFKVRQNLYMPYISVSGPKDNIRLLFDMMQTQFPGDTEEVNANRVPKTKIGFYESGETPFGIVPPAMGRSRMVVRFCDLTEADLKKLREMYYRPNAYLEAAMPGHQPKPEMGR
jgi:hypothetical protein